MRPGLKPAGPRPDASGRKANFGWARRLFTDSCALRSVLNKAAEGRSLNARPLSGSGGGTRVGDFGRRAAAESDVNVRFRARGDPRSTPETGRQRSPARMRHTIGHEKAPAHEFVVDRDLASGRGGLDGFGDGLLTPPRLPVRFVILVREVGNVDAPHPFEHLHVADQQLPEFFEARSGEQRQERQPVRGGTAAAEWDIDRSHVDRRAEDASEVGQAVGLALDNVRLGDRQAQAGAGVDGDVSQFLRYGQRGRDRPQALCVDGLTSQPPLAQIGRLLAPRDPFLEGGATDRMWDVAG